MGTSLVFVARCSVSVLIITLLSLLLKGTHFS